jgi:hypothetical protein
MSKREVTTDLGLGLGLVRWGDHRRDVAACYPDASYGICENIYAFQRIFFVDDLFAGTQPELAGIGAYVEPSAPEVIFDEVPHAHARALLDAIGCPLAVDVDEATWETGASAVTVCGHHDTAWIQVRGPSRVGAEDHGDPRFGAYNAAEDDTWEPDYEAFEDDEG